MKNPFTSKDLSDAASRRVEIAVAMAEERLIETHVDHALSLIELTDNQIQFNEALDIYARLLQLSADEARSISTQALARLGKRDEPSTVEAAEKVDAGSAKGDRRSLLKNMRRRLRGRAKDELRGWIEFQVARTEVALLETHVDNALHFIDILENEVPPTDAVELYLDTLDVRDSMVEAVSNLSLARVSDQYLPDEFVSAQAKTGEGSARSGRASGGAQGATNPGARADESGGQSTRVQEDRT